MPDARAPLAAARPVVTSVVGSGGIGASVSLRAGEDVVAVRCVAPSQHRVAALGQRYELAQRARFAVELLEVPGHEHPMVVVPRTAADAVAGVHRGSRFGCRRTEI